MPNPQFPATPTLPRRIAKVGAPLAVIIALGIVIGVLLLLFTVANPARTIVGFILSTAAMSVVLFTYLWLDRWEPEPRRLLVLAFCWGASVAVVLAFVLEAFGAYLLGATSLGFMAIVAPLIEEATKGLFLLIMMTGRRRNQLNSLTDCMVYAGVTAAGFAWLEDIGYAGQIPLYGDLFRDIAAPFAHPLFTTMTGIGVYFALQRHKLAAKAGCILLGYLAAVVMHGLWNGSMELGAKQFIAVYLFWMVPVFVLMIVLAVLSRRKEQRIVAARLPDMVAANLITPNEATWLGSMRSRRQAIRAANSVDGRPAGKAVAIVAIAAVELAFLRDRIARGFSDRQMLALQAEEAEDLVEARWAAPAGFANYRAY
jgi:RsiW-degrading membrane proteinase PrsW (M82 family)